MVRGYGSDVHALIEELALRWVEHVSEAQLRRVQTSGGGGNGRSTRLRRRRFSLFFTTYTFIPRATSSLQAGNDVCRQPTAPVRQVGRLCKCIVPQGGNQVRETGRVKRGRERERGQEVIRGWERGRGRERGQGRERKRGQQREQKQRQERTRERTRERGREWSGGEEGKRRELGYSPHHDLGAEEKMGKRG